MIVSHHHDVNMCSDGSELEVTVGGEPIAAELPSGVRTGGIYTFGAGDVGDYNDDDDDYKYQFQEQMASCWDLELASEGLSLMGREKM